MGQFSDHPNGRPPGLFDEHTHDHPSPERSDSGGHAGALLHAVEHEIIPRLMRAHPHDPTSTVQSLPGRAGVSPTELRQFVDQVMHGDDAGVHECLQALQARGMPIKRVWLELLAPAARAMGTRWSDDQCDFNEVTVAVGRLHQILREQSATLAHPRPVGQGRSILLAACPGEQHTFGLSMVAEFFHEAGWDVSTSFLSLHQPPARLVREHWYDVVGLTVGGVANLDRLARCIGDIREQSMNRAVPIIAGGPIFALQPELELELKVDAVILDGNAAPALAQRLVERVKVRA